MKARLNLTIDNALLDEMKVYAARKQTSVSELVENFFVTVTRQGRRKSIIDLVEKLKTPSLDPLADLKELYYTEQSGKHGF